MDIIAQLSKWHDIRPAMTCEFFFPSFELYRGAWIAMPCTSENKRNIDGYISTGSKIEDIEDLLNRWDLWDWMGGADVSETEELELVELLKTTLGMSIYLNNLKGILHLNYYCYDGNHMFSISSKKCSSDAEKRT